MKGEKGSWERLKTFQVSEPQVNNQLLYLGLNKPITVDIQVRREESWCYSVQPPLG